MNGANGMTSEQYVATVQQLSLLGQLVMCMDLSKLLQYLDWVDAAGPILDPTAYRAGMKNIDKVRDLAVAGKAFRDAAARVLPLPEFASKEVPSRAVER